MFKFFNTTSNTTAFMLDYQVHAIAEIKWRGGFPEMDAIIDYIVTPRIAMCDVTGKSGYDYRYPMIYYGPIIDARKRAQATGKPVSHWNVQPNPDTPESWKEWFDCIADYGNAHYGGNKWVSPDKLAPDRISGYQSGYYAMIRSSLAALKRIGYDTGASHDWLEAQLNKSWPDVSVWRDYKWAVDPG